MTNKLKIPNENIKLPIVVKLLKRRKLSSR